MPSNLTTTVDVARADDQVIRVRATGDLQKDYAWANPDRWWSALAIALPMWVDVNTRTFGSDLYEDQMYRDPQVASLVDVLRMAAVVDGFELRVPSNVSKVPGPDRTEALKFLDFCAAAQTGLGTPLRDVMFALSEGIISGHKVAELIWEPAAYAPESRTILRVADVRPKPNWAVRLVVDLRNLLLGYLPRNLGISVPIFDGPLALQVGLDGQIQDLLPPYKFVNFVNEPLNNDPRGRSILRTIYSKWWMKQNLEPDYMAFLYTQAQPSYDGELPENPQPVEERDPTGLPTGTVVDAATNMRKGLEALRNGSVMVRPHGSSVNLLQVKSSGETFVQAFDWLDKQMAKGVTKQTLATEQGQSMSRSASQVHQDILGLPVDYLTNALCSTWRYQVLRPQIVLNYGKQEADLYTPEVTATRVEQQDRARVMGGVAALTSSTYFEGYTPQNFADMDAQMGLPIRDSDPSNPVPKGGVPAAAIPGVNEPQNPDEVTPRTN